MKESHKWNNKNYIEDVEYNISNVKEGQKLHPKTSVNKYIEALDELYKRIDENIDVFKRLSDK